MFLFYKDTKFKEACDIGFENFSRYKKDEEFISLYALSCLEVDYINRLAKPIAILRNSKESRANSAYFSVILMQKKLLYHAMIDGYDLSSLKLPTTKYILSKVFDLYLQLGKHLQKDRYLFKDSTDSRLSYKLYLIKNNNIQKIVIEELYNSKIIKIHTYW
ncbi:MAG: hypothetical protein COB17_07395 [Sulfurimonas sp.]|nr:MAG: hypothetical protein COB17_07395 [Sulfurimonas sp.]